MPYQGEETTIRMTEQRRTGKELQVKKRAPQYGFIQVQGSGKQRCSRNSASFQVGTGLVDGDIDSYHTISYHII